MQINDAPHLSDRLTAAINEHLTASGGGMVIGFHAVIQAIDSEGAQCWYSCTAEGQLGSTTMGLIEWARGIAKYDQRRELDAFYEELDEDD